jgi:hypothetical protein
MAVGSNFAGGFTNCRDGAWTLGTISRHVYVLRVIVISGWRPRKMITPQVQFWSKLVEPHIGSLGGKFGEIPPKESFRIRATERVWLVLLVGSVALR